MKFNFIVAYRHKKVLIPYTYFTSVKYANMKYAKEFLEYVKKEEPKRKWKIYKISIIPLIE